MARFKKNGVAMKRRQPQKHDTRNIETVSAIKLRNGRQPLYFHNKYFNSSVQFAALFGAVVGYRDIWSEATVFHASFGNALFDEVVVDRGGAFDRQFLVVAFASDVVGVPADFDSDGWLLLKYVVKRIELYVRHGKQFG